MVICVVYLIDELDAARNIHNFLIHFNGKILIYFLDMRSYKNQMLTISLGGFLFVQMRSGFSLFVYYFIFIISIGLYVYVSIYI